MSRLEDLLERILWAVVGRISGRGVVALALLFYAGGGLVLPLALNWPLWAIVEANVLSTMLAGLLILVWVTRRVEARERRHLVEWTTSLRLLTAEEFEWLVGEVFEREGWKVRYKGRQEEPDGNVDLELTRPGQRKIVQCKRWTAWRVGVDKVREFAGTLSRERLPMSDGIFVTLSQFSQQAQDEANKMGMTLVDNCDLHSRIEKVRRAELCDVCQKPMVLNHSSRGWWLRCIAEGCQGKRDLGNDPGRALELLTQPPAT